MPAPKLNVLCFVTDQQRADHIGCCGNPDLQTPNIDRLAAAGVTFTQSFVANPVCMPNRATMFTGRYPKAHGLRENGLTLVPAELILPDILRQTGYQTASFGKIHLAPFGMTEELTTEDREMVESHVYWEKNNTVPLPFWGFEHLYYVGGHGDYTFGHYKHWLDENHPGMHEKLNRDHAFVIPKGWGSSWKMSIPPELHYNTKIADETIQFLEKRDTNRPFFIWCSFPDPHFPFAAPPPYCHQYDPNQITFAPKRRDGEFESLPPYMRDCYEGKGRLSKWLGQVHEITDENYREMLAHTYGMISMVDHNIGRIMRSLEDLSLTQNTVVLFFSDHGELLGDHWLIHKGPFLFRGLVQVPTIWRLPTALSKGLKCSELVSTVDLCPTLLDLLDVPIPEGVQGRSYKDLLYGNIQTYKDSVYIEFDSSLFNARQRQIRTKEWALTYCSGEEYGMLFDLENDPDELHNLWDNQACGKIKTELLLRLLSETSSADDWLPPRRAMA